MIKNSILSRKTAVGTLVVFGLLLMIVSVTPQVKPGHKFYFPDKAPIVTDDNEVTTKIIVGDNESEGRYTILSDLWKVGFSVPTHYHARHTETFYLVSGEAEWTVNGEKHAMKAGDAVYIPANAPHSTRTLGDKPAHFILIYSAGDYESHLRRELKYTEQEKKDPKVRELLRELNDFNLVMKTQ
jgi:quercetin dioxygenase-like cupin family protein